MRHFFLFSTLALLLLAPIAAVCLLVPRQANEFPAVPLRSFNQLVDTVETKQACSALLGEPVEETVFVGGPLSAPVSEKWTYLTHEAGNAVEVSIWWDISTGRKVRVTYRDPVTGEVMPWLYR